MIPPGYITPNELMKRFHDSFSGIESKAKVLLFKGYVNEINSILKNSITFFRKSFDMGITKVKSKKPIFSVSDTISYYFDQICDTITSRSKAEKHINWHSPDIKTKANKLENVFIDMSSNNVYLNEFTDLSEKSQYLKGMQINLLYVLLLQDKYEEAYKLLNEIEPITVKNDEIQPYRNNDLNEFKELLMKEISSYKKNKVTYQFK
jgi:hypothetical protein